MPRSSFSLLALSLAAAAPVAAQVPFQQDSTLDNLVHPPGYRPAEPATLGEVTVAGRGPTPLILVPGLGFSGADFQPFMAAHASEYTMYAVTLAGFGGTAAPPMPPAGTSYAEQSWIRGAEEALVRLIRERRLRQPVLVGLEGVAAQVVLRLTLEHPELVGGTVLLAGEAGRDLRPGLKVAAARRRELVDQVLAPKWFRTVTRATWDANMWRREVYARDTTRADAIWREVAQVPLPVMIRYLCEFLAVDLGDALPRLQRPLLVLRPGFDSVFAADTANGNALRLLRESWDGLAGATSLIDLETVPGSGMFILEDDPALSARLLAAFVARARPTATRRP